MSDENDDDGTMSVEVVEFLASIMTANADHLHNLNRSLLTSANAERDWIRDGVLAALSGIPCGDTTATYERGLTMIRKAFYPPHEVCDAYRARAAAGGGIALESDDRDPVIERWLDWLTGDPVGVA